MSEFDYSFNNPDFIIPSNFTTEVLKYKNALPFHQSLSRYKPTPLLALPGLAKDLGIGSIFLKDESYRFGLNAFKGLGASFAVHELLKKNPSIEAFCTATDGNHGRALAWSSNNAGKKSIVFVPSDTSYQRIKAIEREGATVVQLNKNYDDTCAHAARISKQNGWELVQDTAWEGYEEVPADIMAGYLTHFKEIDNGFGESAKPPYDIVFLQVGVGSWAGAAAFYFLQKYGNNCPLLVTVEPSGSAGLLESFKEQSRTLPKDNYHTIMAGLSCGIPSLTGWELLRNAISVAIKIPDDFARKAMRKLYYPMGEDQRVISGESGAAGLAGLLAILEAPELKPVSEKLGLNPSSKVLLFSTEGDTDRESFNKIIA